MLFINVNVEGEPIMVNLSHVTTIGYHRGDKNMTRIAIPIYAGRGRTDDDVEELICDKSYNDIMKILESNGQVIDCTLEEK